MEIIAEIILQVLGWMLQLLAELLFQMMFEALAEWFGHALKKPFHRPRPARPWLAAVGYLSFGAVAGGFSVWLMPERFIKAQWLQVVNLVFTPLLAGFIMETIGSWRERRAKDVLRLESFTYGFCFAFAMAIVRYAFCK